MGHVLTFDNMPEDNVIAVQPWTRGRSDIELRRVRVRTIVRHGEHPRPAVSVHKRLVVELARTLQ